MVCYQLAPPYGHFHFFLAKFVISYIFILILDVSEVYSEHKLPVPLFSEKINTMDLTSLKPTFFQKNVKNNFFEKTWLWKVR